MQAFRANVMFFFDPSQIAAGEVPPGQRFRLGGMVEKGSVEKTAGYARREIPRHRLQTHGAGDVLGILPDLFREGQGVVAHGTMNDGVFVADEILAKHDEKYMPPEVARSLKDNPPPPDVNPGDHMIPELGQFALILALVLAGAQAFFGLCGAQRGDARWQAVVRPAVAGQFVLISTAIGALVYAFVSFDFSVLYVASNSNSALPTFYRVAALWGAHEGSLLLWALDPLGVDARGRHVQPQSAREFREPRDGRARLRELRLPVVHRWPPRIRSSASCRCRPMAAI